MRERSAARKRDHPNQDDNGNTHGYATVNKKKAPFREPCSLSQSTLLAVLAEVFDGADHLAGVAVLVIVPRDNLHLIAVIADF